MDTNQILLLLFVFGAVAMLAFTVMGIFAPKPVQDRLKQVAGRDLDRERFQTDWQHKLVEFIGPLGKIALPQEGWENSPLRHRFMHAGFRGQSAPLLFFGVKTLLTIALPGLFMLYTGLTTVSLSFNSLLMGLLALAALGYYLPNIYLSRRIASRQRDIFEGFPDAIDLMMVCVEAGLGIDAAINRVASEIGLKSPLLAEEFHLVSLELRAGATRERALRNLALRTGVEEVDLLVSMLVQADRFGTSIADSLRVHADSLRTKRRQRAEEAAAKIPLKLLFPLIFCIFPSLLLVLLGPAFISIYRVLLPTLAGQ